MTLLYLTADKVGLPTGGGTVTHQESLAMQEMGACEVWDRDALESFKKYYLTYEEPWCWDDYAYAWLDEPRVTGPKSPPKLPGLKDFPISLTHVYAGTFTTSLRRLRERNGSRISYTAAAHSIEVSRREHEKLGIPYNYPHLTEPAQFQRYVGGYLQADVLICPSQHSANVMRVFGATNRIEIVPHGCNLPEAVVPPPQQFILGYAGAIGPDKGLPYLLQAWKKLNYSDAVLRLAGRDSTSSWMQHLISHFGGGNIELLGWVEDIGTFYDGLSCYCQASTSEGFGCEVSEAMAHGRAVICSDGAGAADLLRTGSPTTADLVPGGCVVPACNVDALAAVIDEARKYWNFEEMGQLNREIAAQYTWPKIREKYQAIWRGLLNA